MTQTNNQYQVPEQNLQAVLDYLAKRPYAEVATIVKGIMDNAKLVTVETPAKAEGATDGQG